MNVNCTSWCRHITNSNTNLIRKPFHLHFSILSTTCPLFSTATSPFRFVIWAPVDSALAANLLFLLPLFSRILSSKRIRAVNIEADQLEGLLTAHWMKYKVVLIVFIAQGPSLVACSDLESSLPFHCVPAIWSVFCSTFKPRSSPCRSCHLLFPFSDIVFLLFLWSGHFSFFDFCSSDISSEKITNDLCTLPCHNSDTYSTSS